MKYFLTVLVFTFVVGGLAAIPVVELKAQTIDDSSRVVEITGVVFKGTVRTLEARKKSYERQIELLREKINEINTWLEQV